MTRFVFLHGFTQTHHHCHRIADLVRRRLDVDPEIAFVDLPGHGLNSPDATSIDDAASLATAGGPGCYVGYSLGGRWALAAAATGATQIERLVVIGGTVGISDPDERAARTARDEALAARIEAIGVEAFVGEWLAAPMFAGLPPDPVGARQRAANTPGGLASSLRLAGAGVQSPVWDRLDSVRIPVLLITGENDQKFTAIADRLAAALPLASRATIAGAGHAAHLERADEVADAIAAWLRY